MALVGEVAIDPVAVEATGAVAEGDGGNSAQRTDGRGGSDCDKFLHGLALALVVVPVLGDPGSDIALHSLFAIVGVAGVCGDAGVSGDPFRGDPFASDPFIGDALFIVDALSGDAFSALFICAALSFLAAMIFIVAFDGAIEVGTGMVSTGVRSVLCGRRRPKRDRSSSAESDESSGRIAADISRTHISSRRRVRIDARRRLRSMVRLGPCWLASAFAIAFAVAPAGSGTEADSPDPEVAGLAAR